MSEIDMATNATGRQFKHARLETDTNPSPKRIKDSRVLAVAFLAVALTMIVVFVFLLTYVPHTVDTAATVRISQNWSAYAFGPNRTLLIFNLTAHDAYVGETLRGLRGFSDLDVIDKRIAAMSMFRYGEVHNDIHNVPIALQQRGGLRPQINLNFVLLQDDLKEQRKLSLLDDSEERYDKYFVRGCWNDPSCTRDRAATVMQATPKLKGDAVGVLFWQPHTGYTYEGVYNLFVEIGEPYFTSALPQWTEVGTAYSDACTWDSSGLIFESEVSRPRSGGYTPGSLEDAVSAYIKYPTSDYLDSARKCNNTYQRMLDFLRLPNFENQSFVPLEYTTFVEMYVASQLMMQVDFGFYGMQSYYHKVPGRLTLGAGPPYDFDGPWDICGKVDRTPDIVSCHHGRGRGPNEVSPVWRALGHTRDFLAVLGGPFGTKTLISSHQAVDALYASQIRLAEQGHFHLHEQRWPLRREVSLNYRLEALCRRCLFDRPRSTVKEELEFQRTMYRRRAEHMLTGIRDLDSFQVRVEYNTAYFVTIASCLWWFPVFMPFFFTLSVLLFRRERATCGSFPKFPPIS